MSLVAEKRGVFESAAVKKLKPILVVEDNFNDLFLALRELKKLKIRNPVDSVATVDEMIQYMVRAGEYYHHQEYPHPGLIILDMHLQQADPLEALSWLRGRLKFRKIPIVAISSREQDRVLQRAVDLGAVSRLTKPFEGADFERLAMELAVGLEFSD
jgi:CheY-like chemotaxis protein